MCVLSLSECPRVEGFLWRNALRCYLVWKEGMAQHLPRRRFRNRSLQRRTKTSKWSCLLLFGHEKGLTFPSRHRCTEPKTHSRPSDWNRGTPRQWVSKQWQTWDCWLRWDLLTTQSTRKFRWLMRRVEFMTLSKQREVFSNLLSWVMQWSNFRFHGQTSWGFISCHIMSIVEILAELPPANRWFPHTISRHIG